MKKLILILVVLVGFGLNGMSQNDTVSTKASGSKKTCCMKFSSLSVDMASLKYRTLHNTDKDFDPMKDNNGNFNMGKGNSMMNGNNGTSTTGKEMTFEMGFNPYCKKLGDYNKKQEFVFGFFYSGSDLANQNSEKFSSTVGDTFSFHQVLYQNDTMIRSRSDYRESANVLGVTAKYLFKTDPERRFSLFTGIGLKFACTVTSRVYKRNSEDTAVVINYYNVKPNFGLFDDANNIGTSDTWYRGKAETTLFTSVFAPFGVNMRLCKKKEIWNQMNIFMQGIVGLELETKVKGGTHLNPFMGCSMGFKFDFQ